MSDYALYLAKVLQNQEMYPDSLPNTAQLAVGHFRTGNEGAGGYHGP